MLDARLLGEFAFGFKGLELALKEQEIAPEEHLNRLENFAQRRLKGEPVARIIGVKEFYSLNFSLNEATLIPRPETELLVDLALEHIKNIKQPKILELGVGSGAILISILANKKNAKAIGVDISEQALLMAQVNAKHIGVEDRVDFLHGSWFEPIVKNEKFDLIISNPPYIKSDEIQGLQKEVKLFDPILALDGGNEGLAPYQVISNHSKTHLRENGAVIVEFGQGQEKDVEQIFLLDSYDFIAQHTDLGAVIRAIVAKK